MAGPSRHSLSGKGATGLPSIAITAASAPSKLRSPMRVESRLSRRRRTSPPAGSAIVGAISAFTVRTVPKVPALSAPRVVENGSQPPVVLVEPPVLQDEDEVGVVRRRLVALDDHDAREPPPELGDGVAMRVEPEGAGVRRLKAIGVALAGLHGRLGEIGHAVLVVRDAQPVPVDRAVLRQPVLEIDAERLALFQAHEVERLVGIGPDAARRTVRPHQLQRTLRRDERDPLLALAGGRVRSGSAAGALAEPRAESSAAPATARPPPRSARRETDKRDVMNRLSAPPPSWSGLTGPSMGSSARETSRIPS